MKNILLIGASGGLGRKFAIELANSGYNLGLHYHNGLENLKNITEILESSGVNFKFYGAEISKEDEVKRMIENFSKDIGEVNILINNAGISLDGVSWKLETETWQKVLDVNLTGPFLCIKHVLPSMRNNNWGRIINISSVVAQTGVPGTSAYAASKSGLFGLTKTIAKEIANKEITINTIALGYFNEGMIKQVPEDFQTILKNNIPKHEFGDPKDIINCIKYLIDETSRYITGQIININGGLFS
jgi:3-oxoacyl-[acyl-carrier protein] reductase